MADDASTTQAAAATIGRHVFNQALDDRTEFETRPEDAEQKRKAVFGAAAVAGLAGLAAVGPITAVAAAGGAGYIASTKASEAGALLRDVGGVAYGAGEDARRFERRYQMSEGLSAAGGAAVHGAKVTWDRASSLNREHRVTAKLGEAAHATARGLGTAAERARGAKVPKPNQILSIFK